MISDHIKQIIGGYIDHAELSNFELATVISINPVTIKLTDVPKPIGGEYLIVPQRLVDRTYKGKIKVKGSIPVKLHNFVTINGGVRSTPVEAEGNIEYMNILNVSMDIDELSMNDYILKPGDKVVVIKATGGQKYFVIDKVV